MKLQSMKRIRIISVACSIQHMLANDYLHITTGELWPEKKLLRKRPRKTTAIVCYNVSTTWLALFYARMCQYNIK